MKTNRVILIGYIGHHLSLKRTESGTSKTSFRMATHYRGQDGSGLSRWQTIWHTITAWGKMADRITGMTVKGSRVLIEGYICYRTYKDYSGHTRYITEIRAESFLNLDR